MKLTLTQTKLLKKASGHYNCSVGVTTYSYFSGSRHYCQGNRELKALLDLAEFGILGLTFRETHRDANSSRNTKFYTAYQFQLTPFGLDFVEGITA
jgi:hypothetical protein